MYLLIREVFLGTMSPYGIDLSSNPDPFLVGCLLPARHRGERHIAIEGEVCPELLESRDDQADVIFSKITAKGEI
jgi:hypothetical protein